MKRKIVFGIIGGFLIALAFISFILHALLQIKTGNEWAYHNYRYQWTTYLGALATLGIAALIGLVGLYHRVKRFVQKKSARE
jgi:hypothetical protein